MSEHSVETLQLARLILDAAKLMVDLPEETKVNILTERNITVFQIETNKKDIGKLIGKGGRNIQSLRRIVSSIGAKLSCNCMVEIKDDHSLTYRKNKSASTEE